MKYLSESDIAAIVRERQDSEVGAKLVPVPTAMFEIESREDAQQLLALLNRAANTLEPAAWPKWLPGWFERLERPL